MIIASFNVRLWWGKQMGMSRVGDGDGTRRNQRNFERMTGSVRLESELARVAHDIIGAVGNEEGRNMTSPISGIPDDQICQPWHCPSHMIQPSLYLHLPMVSAYSDIPGLDQPLNYESESTCLFPNLLNNDKGRAHRLAYSHYKEAPPTSELPLTTLREFTMLHIMNAVTDKPNWNIKVFIFILFCLIY